MSIQRRDMSGDPMFNLWVSWDDVSMKLQQIECVNRYPDRNVAVTLVPYNITTGVEDPSSAITRTYAPGADVVDPFPQQGAHVITLTTNSRGIPIGYNTYIGVSQAIA